MSLDISAATIFNALTTGVITVIGWMLRGIYADFKAALAEISAIKIEHAVVKEQIKTLRTDIDEVRNARR